MYVCMYVCMYVGVQVKKHIGMNMQMEKPKHNTTRYEIVKNIAHYI